MIVLGVLAGCSAVVEIEDLILLVSERDVIPGMGRIARWVDDAESERLCPIDPSGSLTQGCERGCILLLNKEETPGSLAGVRRGYGEGSPVLWAAVCFAEAERKLLCGFLSSQPKRLEAGAPYGGEHYRDYAGALWDRSQSDIEVWIGDADEDR